MGDIDSTCDRIIVLEGGQVVEQGAVADFTQETSTIVIDVDDGRDALAAALARRGIEAVIEGASVIVELENEELYDAVRDAIVGVLAGTTIADLAERDRLAKPGGTRYII